MDSNHFNFFIMCCWERADIRALRCSLYSYIPLCGGQPTTKYIYVCCINIGIEGTCGWGCGRNTTPWGGGEGMGPRWWVSRRGVPSAGHFSNSPAGHNVNSVFYMMRPQKYSIITILYIDECKALWVWTWVSTMCICLCASVHVCVPMCVEVCKVWGWLKICMFMMNEGKLSARNYTNEYGCLHGVQPA